ncbi:CdaR family transcriptional regulator [Paraburkholderia sp. BL25I1N1]|uniref:PucR family transcriptional regulator n=1 Tax=Paraburkholderia sp. BL25I1N1 TaxID=1938804 RepID=UPI000D06414C|nr:helix-turn-helix domain-containing protein [Paraburkholderia sp. BL25I1N1]PRY04017.1 PucR-like helix-turn-helix protein [Paraburkholderia sp. BL25I1N1]
MPIISNRLREKTAALAHNPSPLIDRVYATLTSPNEYQALTPALRHDVAESITFSVNLWFKSLLSGELPTAADLSGFEQLVHRSVHQFVPLNLVLRALRQSSRELWRAYIELGKPDGKLVEELLFDVSPYFFDYFEVMVRSIARAYRDEQHRQTRWRNSLRQLLCNILFYSPHDAKSFRKTAEALGLDFSAPRIALALDVEVTGIDSSTREDEFERISLAASRHLKVAPDDLMRAWHRERLIIWVPCVRGDSITRSDRLVTDRAASLALGLPHVQRIGVGLMNEGASGWARSAEEALKAIDFSPKRHDRNRVSLYSSIVMAECARHTDTASRYLSALLQQLSSEPDLVSTLEVYLEKNQRRKQSALVLGIHPNTLNYRIERIESLLGASLDDVGWISKLDIALKLRRSTLAGC